MKPGVRIAISGLSGCGNTTACHNVANAMNLKVVNYTFRNLAQDMNLKFEEILEKRKEDPSYDYLLDRKQIDLVVSQDNTIMGSRLACWLVHADLKVWLESPLRERAARIAERETRDYYEVLVETKTRDEYDIAQILEVKELRQLLRLSIQRNSWAERCRAFRAPLQSRMIDKVSIPTKCGRDSRPNPATGIGPMNQNKDRHIELTVAPIDVEYQPSELVLAIA